MDEDEAQIRRLLPAWLAASKSGDRDAMLDLMTEDVVFLVPGAAPFGKAAFDPAFDAMKGVSIAGESVIEELEIAGPIAVLRTRIAMQATPPGADKPVRRSGYTLSVVRKEADGRWRLSRDANLLTTEPETVPTPRPASV